MYGPFGSVGGDLRREVQSAPGNPKIGPHPLKMGFWVAGNLLECVGGSDLGWKQF
ncbi:MAG: hypothetical protein IPP17_26975 [Bacteroidetes bacterium]|nr:hypothetical protein [Bacteroidota bacterium]